jgi:hypothetical protein
MKLFRRVAHWSPRYVYSRTKVEFFRRRYGGPNLAIGAVKFLTQWLKPTDIMLEYGSGYSTAWFGQRVSKLISVEDNAVWYSRVMQQIAQGKLCNIELHLLNQGPVLEGTAVGTDYISILAKYPSESFDVVLNDGWARPYVAARLDLVRPGGLFIWDDYAGSFPTETHIPGALPVSSVVRDPKLLEFLQRTSHWRKVIWDDGTHCTSFFFRP